MSKINKAQEEKALALRNKLADDFNEKETMNFATSNSDKKWHSDFMLLFNMLKDSNFKLSKRNKVLIMGTLAYIVLPIDIIPDFIPVIGWLDDIFILAYTLKSLQEEIQEYKTMKETVNAG